MSLFLLLSSLLFGIFLLRLNLLLSTSHIRAGTVLRLRDRAARERRGGGRRGRGARPAPLRPPPPAKEGKRESREHNSPRLTPAAAAAAAAAPGLPASAPPWPALLSPYKDGGAGSLQPLD